MIKDRLEWTSEKRKTTSCNYMVLNAIQCSVDGRLFGFIAIIEFWSLFAFNDCDIEIALMSRRCNVATLSLVDFFFMLTRCCDVGTSRRSYQLHAFLLSTPKWSQKLPVPPAIHTKCKNKISGYINTYLSVK